MVTLNELLAFCQEYAMAHPDHRRGQAYFNAVHVKCPEIADAIRGGDDDPFYNDGKIDRFFLRVAAELEDRA